MKLDPVFPELLLAAPFSGGEKKRKKKAWKWVGRKEEREGQKWGCHFGSVARISNLFSQRFFGESWTSTKMLKYPSSLFFAEPFLYTFLYDCERSRFLYIFSWSCHTRFAPFFLGPRILTKKGGRTKAREENGQRAERKWTDWLAFPNIPHSLKRK